VTTRANRRDDVGVSNTLAWVPTPCRERHGWIAQLDEPVTQHDLAFYSPSAVLQNQADPKWLGPLHYLAGASREADLALFILAYDTYGAGDVVKGTGARGKVTCVQVAAG
jgi:hypothetical protein